MTPTPDLTIRPARTAEAKQLGQMMVAGLDSRLNDLGPWFVTFLHRHMVVSDYCICLVAERDGNVVGYGAAFTNTSQCYRDFLLKKGVLAGIMMLPWLVLPRNLRTALSGLTYSGKAPQNDPAAELVSLVVSPAARRSGVGQALFQHILAALDQRGITQLKITTSTENKGANAFYERQGSQYLRSEPLYHDAQLNVYVHHLV